MIDVDFGDEMYMGMTPLKELIDTGDDGLTDAEAERRLGIYGRNELEENEVQRYPTTTPSSPSSSEPPLTPLVCVIQPGTSAHEAPEGLFRSDADYDLVRHHPRGGYWRLVSME